MIVGSKIKEDSSRAISILLVNVIEACRQGEVNVALELGLDINMVRKLDSLRPDQISHLSCNYVRDVSAAGIFKLDPEKMARVIDHATKECEVEAIIDQYLIRGASKAMMSELFGLRSTQISCRKKMLNIASSRGRMSIASTDQEEKIYKHWNESAGIEDMIERYLHVAEKTDVPLSRIYKIVKSIEELEMQKQNRMSA